MVNLQIKYYFVAEQRPLFRKFTEDRDANTPNQIDHLGTSYDHRSILHSFKDAFASGDDPAITCLPEDPACDDMIGTLPEPSNTDLLRIRRLYGLE